MLLRLILSIGLLLTWSGPVFAIGGGGGGGGGNSSLPTGPAGGDLTGTYPNPQVASISNSNAGSAAFLTAPMVGALTGWTSLEQWQPHALPIVAGPTALTCTGTSGTFPFNDDYEGTLGAVNVTVSLPASGCSAGSLITLVVTQGSSAASFTVTGTKEGSELWSIGTASGNRITLQYQFDAANTAWQVYNPGTYPAQGLPVSVGGTGATTLTSNAPLFGNGTSALTQGTRSGNTTKVATTTGTLTNGHCIQVDANGNFIDAGTGCSAGSTPAYIVAAAAKQIIAMSGGL